MGKSTQIFVKIVDPKPKYGPGAWIEGIVHVVSLGEVNARAVRLKYFGEERTHWVVSSGKNSTTYGATNELWTTYLTLWGYPKGDAGEAKPLPPGSYAFPFCVQIPLQTNMPTATCYAGKVQYVLQAYIDIPFAIDKEVDYPIVVELGTISKSDDPKAAVELEQDSGVGCCLCECTCCGHVKIRARCLNPEVLPGEKILCTAEVKNNSNYEVDAIEISLMKRMDCRANVNTSQKPKETFEEESLLTMRYPIIIPTGMTYSNLDFTPTTADMQQTPETTALIGKQKDSGPFVIPTPLTLPPCFVSGLITSSLRLVVRVLLFHPCARDVRLTFELPAPTLSQTDDSNPAALTADTSRTPVFLNSTSTGRYQAYFSFDGMDYNYNEQSNVNKPVSYPYFVETNTEAVPRTLDSFNSTWRSLLK